MKIKDKKRLISRLKDQLIAIEWVLSRDEFINLSEIAKCLIEFCNTELNEYDKQSANRIKDELSVLTKSDIQFTKTRIGMARMMLLYLQSSLENDINSHNSCVQNIITILSLLIALLSLFFGIMSIL